MKNNITWNQWWTGRGLKKNIISFVKKGYFNKYFAYLPLRFGPKAIDSDVICEAGCGEAGSLMYIKKKVGCSTIGIDLSEEVISTAGQRCDHFVCGDLFFLPLKDKSVDVVFNQGVIEHFNDDDIQRIIKELRRVCRKKVVICVPATTSFFRFVYNPFKVLNGRFMSAKELKSLMSHEFRNVKARYLFGSGFLSLVAWGEV